MTVIAVESKPKAKSDKGKRGNKRKALSELKSNVTRDEPTDIFPQTTTASTQPDQNVRRRIIIDLLPLIIEGKASGRIVTMN